MAGLAFSLFSSFTSSAEAGTYAITYSGGQSVSTGVNTPDGTYTQPYSGTYGGSGSTSWNSPGASVNCSGGITATATWQSTGPGDNPPTSALVQESGTATWRGNGISVPTGKCDDGLKDPEVDQTTPPGNGTPLTSVSGVSTGVHYWVKSNPGQSFQLTPTPSASISCAVTPGGGSASVSYTAAVYPLVISAPDPMGRPDFGDGSNQFVYSNDPGGGPHLNLPVVIGVPGSSADATAWLVPKVNVSCDIPAESKLETNMTPMAAAGQISFQTIYATLGGGSQTTSGFVYTGLPTNNTGFGAHIATLHVSGSNSQQAQTETFFSPNASTWPISDSVTPNWYHYYNQVSPSGGSFYPGSGSSHTDQLQDASGNRTAHTQICNPPPGFRIFGLNPTVSPYVIYLGTLYTGGIHSYIYAHSHESGHATAWLTPGLEYVPGGYGNPGSYYDLVPSWKNAHHLQSVNSNGQPVYDTTGAYANIPSKGGPPDPGDTECVADIQALQPLLSSSTEWQVDWSSTGLQIGAPYFYANKVANFYWTFYPNTFTSVHATPSGQPDSNGAYHITGLQDLSGVYPGTTILTSLSQLN